MNRITTLLLLTLGAASVSGSELKLVTKSFVGLGQNSERPTVFLRVGDQEIMCPLLGNPVSEHHNKTNELYAVNFHGVSNYSSCGLILSVADKIIMYPDLFTFVKGQLVQTRRVLDMDFSSTSFEVWAIEDNKLLCHFSGIKPNVAAPTEVHFHVAIHAAAQAITLSLED